VITTPLPTSDARLRVSATSEHSLAEYIDFYNHQQLLGGIIATIRAVRTVVRTSFATSVPESTYGSSPPVFETSNAPTFQSNRLEAGIHSL
jgi:hypothetical protein